jgi:putative phage-type endonuclease
VLPAPAGVELHPATRKLFSREQFPQRTPEWFEARRGLITASDAAAALGIKPYKTYRGDPRADLLAKKLNDAPVQGMALAHGVKYEDAARDAAMAELGDTCYEFGLLVHPEHPWLAASPDGVTATGKCVEIKCPLRRKITPGGPIPEIYEVQVQLQLAVTDMETALFIQYQPAHVSETGQPFMDIQTVKRDREWFDRALPELKRFYDEYQAARASHVKVETPDTNVCLIVDSMYDSDTTDQGSADQGSADQGSADQGSAEESDTDDTADSTGDTAHADTSDTTDGTDDEASGTDDEASGTDDEAAETSDQESTNNWRGARLDALTAELAALNREADAMRRTGGHPEATDIPILVRALTAGIEQERQLRDSSPECPGSPRGLKRKFV